MKVGHVNHAVRRHVTMVLLHHHARSGTDEGHGRADGIRGGQIYVNWDVVVGSHVRHGHRAAQGQHGLRLPSVLNEGRDGRDEVAADGRAEEPMAIVLDSGRIAVDSAETMEEDGNVRRRA